MIEDIFEAVCPTCGRRNEVRVKVCEESFNYWEEFHCDWCGLVIDSVRASSMPQTRIIEETYEESVK